MKYFFLTPLFLILKYFLKIVSFISNHLFVFKRVKFAEFTINVILYYFEVLIIITLLSYDQSPFDLTIALFCLPVYPWID